MLKNFFRIFYIAYFILSFLAILFIVLPFYFLLALPQNAQSRKRLWKLTQVSCKIWLWTVGMPVQLKGNIAKDKKFVIIANHVSYLDPLALYACLPYAFRPLAKKEIARTPLFGYIYGQVAILVDRSNTTSRGKSLKKMEYFLKNECNVFIYPEGTFNETGQAMKSFYDGAFKLAISTQTPLLPILFPDTKQRWHYSAWWKLWPGKNRAIVLEPIAVDGLTDQDCKVLKQKVFELMSDQMQKLQGAQSNL